MTRRRLIPTAALLLMMLMAVTTAPSNRKQVTGPGHTGIYGPIRTDITDAGTNLFNVAHPTDSTVGFVVELAIRGDDGASFYARTATVRVTSVNDSGAWTSTIPEVYTQTTTGGSTLTVVYAISGANPAVFRVTPTGSLVETSYHVTWKLTMLSDSEVTIL